MAPKRPSLLDEPPAASTSEEEEEATSEEEEYENGPETEPEPKRKRPKISTNHASDKEVDRTTSALSEMVAFIKSSDMVGGLSERVLKQALDSLGEPRRAELEEKWKKLNLAELELYAKRVQLISDRAKLILDACNKSSGYTKC